LCGSGCKGSGCGRGYLEDFQKPENVGNAIVEFNRALQYEPNYALALSGLGEAYWGKYEQTKHAELVRQASLHASVPFNWTMISPQDTFAWTIGRWNGLLRKSN